jgi:hypothetical protein
VKLGISVKLVWLFLFVLQSPEWPYRRTYGFNGNARGRTAGGLKHAPLQLQMRLLPDFSGPAGSFVVAGFCGRKMPAGTPALLRS